VVVPSILKYCRKGKTMGNHDIAANIKEKKKLGWKRSIQNRRANPVKKKGGFAEKKPHLTAEKCRLGRAAAGLLVSLST